jgi:hypothetical protein
LLTFCDAAQPLSLFQRLSQIFGLECVDLALFIELLGLDLEHIGLIPYFLGLFMEGPIRKDCRDDREYGEDRSAPRSDPTLHNSG